MRMNRALMVLAATGLAVCAGVAIGQGERKSTQPNTNVQPTPQAQAWIDAAKLTQNHELLKQFLGVWSCDVTSYMPGGQTANSKGIMTCLKTFEGRFVTSTYSGQMMGQPFQGVSTMGFNSVKNQFESTWIDNMSTGIMFETGKCDSSGKTFTFTGKFDDPMSGQTKLSKSVYTFQNADTYTLDMFETESGGNETKMMSITFTRTSDIKASTPGRNVQEIGANGQTRQAPVVPNKVSGN